MLLLFPPKSDIDISSDAYWGASKAQEEGWKVISGE